MNIEKIIKNIGIVFLPLVIGSVTGLLLDTNLYKRINRPYLSPPSVVFPIVWSILYLLMGISLYMVKNDFEKEEIFTTFYISLFFNCTWSIIFFNFEWFTFAIIWLMIIIFFVIKWIAKLYQIKKAAAYLQLPYFFWLLFALYLNIGVAILN